MDIIKYILITYISLSQSFIFSAIYISDAVNKTDETVTMIYTTKESIEVKNSRSITTGDRDTNAAVVYKKGFPNATFITLPPKTITSLSRAYIPVDFAAQTKKGINIGLGKSPEPLSLTQVSGGTGIFALITQKKDYIEQVPVKNKGLQFTGRQKMTQGDLIEESNYIIEIDSPNKIDIYPWKKEIIESYSNPGKLSPQDLLHKAIIEDSSEDIKKALAAGANINLGTGNQPPLLLAVIMGKEKAIQELLNAGANTNISYQDVPLVTYFVRRWNLKTARDFLNKGSHLSEVEKQYLIDYIMFNNPYNLDQDAITILKILGYNIKDNFDSNDLLKNKWYLLLSKNLGRLGLIDNGLVTLFLNNGADPNKMFTLQDGAQWTPILLVLDSYVQSRKKGGINEGYYGSATENIISTMLTSGGDINLTAKLMPSSDNESPLSYALKYDELGSIIDYLTKKGASIAIAIELFLKNGGSSHKTLKNPYRNGSFSLLLWAVENNNPKAVQLLVNAGAQDSTALKLAISKGYSEIINILMSH